MTLRLMLLQCCIIYKLISKKPKKNRPLDDSTDNIVSNKDRGANQWSPVIYNETLKCISTATACDSLLNILQGEHSWKIVLLQLTEKIKLLLNNGNENFISTLKDHMMNNVTERYNIPTIRSLLYLVQINQYNQFEESATIVLFEDVLKIISSQKNIDFRSYVNMLQFFLSQLSPKAMTVDIYIIKETTFDDIWKRSAILRCLVHNNFNQDFNTTSDNGIIQKTLELLVEISEHHLLHTDCLLYDVKIHEQSFTNVVNTVEFMNILQTSILNFPYKLTVQNWDAVRIGLSAWLLSLSKSIEHIQNPQVVIFVVSVFKLYSAFGSFINDERQKSSTEVITNVIDEWDSLFDRDISIIIFKIYRNVVEYEELASRDSVTYNTILENLSPAMEYINYGSSLKYYKSQTTNENILGFLLENLANRIHCIRTSCGRVLKRLTQYFVEQDVAMYENKIENLNANATTDWHFLSMFEEYIKSYGGCISKYLNEFNFKLSAIDELETMDRNDSLAYMFLWDCIIHVCANSPISLRSIYTNWLQDKQHEEKFLLFLFRAMPTEILKNHDSKLMCTDVFKGLTWNQIQDRNLAVEKYACHLYTEMLRKLPALVRKWWSACQSRQKTFIDKLTTNFVSPIICAEELKALGDKKEKHENMQVTVHTSTREVLAVYSIDDVRMELLITLALNHPLGSVKVEAGKQIGGRLSSRNTGMQLTIFLTHQNGSIFDGLTLWKKNLDKKFEGIEECYVCYSVIHHDTCQLPKLSCKTCKKKFHAPCLYKWFMTSSKSTCPICRNVF